MNPETKALFDDLETSHSFFQIDRFIIGSAGTPYGQYKQALRELYKRYRGLQGLYFDRELLAIDIKEQKDNVNGKRRLEIELIKMEMKKEDLDRSIKETEREFSRFYAHAVALKKVIGELTPEKKETLEKEYWADNLSRQFHLEMETTGRVSKNVLDAVSQLPHKERMGIFPNACWDKIESQKPLRIEPVDIKGLI